MEHGAKSIVLKGRSETACHEISKEKDGLEYRKNLGSGISNYLCTCANANIAGRTNEGANR